MLWRYAHIRTEAKRKALDEVERRRAAAREHIRRVSRETAKAGEAASSARPVVLDNGVYRADTAERHALRRAFLDDLKAAVPVYAIAQATAELVGKTGAEASATGATIPFDDLLIAACALSAATV